MSLENNHGIPPFVEVYITALPKDAPIGEVACRARMEEILSIKNEKVRREKYFVWKLLCYALRDSLGLDEEKLEFKKEDYGGWSLGDIFFSLSHSDGAIAVAVASCPVGIDVERTNKSKSGRYASRIMNENELLTYGSTPDGFIEAWCIKEAIFKSKHKDAFVPRDIDTQREPHKEGSIAIMGDEYFWAVSAESLGAIGIHTDIEL